MWSIDVIFSASIKSLKANKTSFQTLMNLHNSFSKKKSNYCDRQTITSSLTSCKNFNVTNRTQKVFKVTPNLEYLLIMTGCSCKTRSITLQAIVLELCPLLTRNFKQNDDRRQTSDGTACGVLVFYIYPSKKIYHNLKNTYKFKTYLSVPVRNSYMQTHLSFINNHLNSL